MNTRHVPCSSFLLKKSAIKRRNEMNCSVRLFTIWYERSTTLDWKLGKVNIKFYLKFGWNFFPSKICSCKDNSMVVIYITQKKREEKIPPKNICDFGFIWSFSRRPWLETLQRSSSKTLAFKLISKRKVTLHVTDVQPKYEGVLVRIFWQKSQIRQSRR